MERNINITAHKVERTISKDKMMERRKAAIRLRKQREMSELTTDICDAIIELLSRGHITESQFGGFARAWATAFGYDPDEVEMRVEDGMNAYFEEYEEARYASAKRYHEQGKLVF